MSAATNYLEDEVLDHVLGKGTRDFTSPTALFVGLLTAVSDGEAASWTEVSGTNYARTAVTFGAASSGSASNSADVEFPAAGSGGWGTVTHIAIFDAASAGNALFYGALSASRAVDEADIFTIVAGNLSISLA